MLTLLAKANLKTWNVIEKLKTVPVIYANKHQKSNITIVSNRQTGTVEKRYT